MYSFLMDGAYAGLAAGAILTFLSHVTPRIGAGNFIKEPDPATFFGRQLTRRESHLIGVLIHLFLSLLYGILFAFGVVQGWVTFSLLPILAWSVVLLVFAGLIVMPLEGHGFFGTKHDPWFALDVFLTNILWGLIYLGLIRLWLPM